MGQCGAVGCIAVQWGALRCSVQSGAVQNRELCARCALGTRDRMGDEPWSCSPTQTLLEADKTPAAWWRGRLEKAARELTETPSGTS